MREYGMTLRDKVCSCDIRKVLNVEPLRREKSSYVGSAMCPEYPIRLREARVADYTHRKRPRSFPNTRPRDYISHLAVSHLGAAPEELRGIAENHEVFRFLFGLPPRDPL